MIEAAIDLFHVQGVHGTSVDEILAKSGTGKSQFSHYFKTKGGLIHATLDYLATMIKSGAVPTGYHVTSWDEMEAWFHKYIAYQEMVHFERSCPIGTIGNDVTNDQALLRQDLRLFFQWANNQLERFFAERKAIGELDASADPDALASFCISIMEGGMLMTKITRDPKTFEQAVGQAIAYLRSIRKKA
jgi:TetR/AcrR family transcriptional regulator, transcriptional repressor for nem operon